MNILSGSSSPDRKSLTNSFSVREEQKKVKGGSRGGSEEGTSEGIADFFYPEV